jgi:GNAT superfamily N-acetyltransferase
VTEPLDIDVRDAVSADLPLLASAHRLGQLAVVEARGGPLDTLLRGRQEPIEDSFASDIAADEVYVRVGTGDERFLGYNVLRIDELPNGDRIGTLVDLFVHSKARGIGVGAALMRDATSTARDRGCQGIDARALPGDRTTKNFFESFGLVARSIEVHKAIS